MRKVPEAGEGKRGEGGYLGYLLRQAAAAYRNRAERALSDLGLTQPQFSVLTMVTAYPGLSNADVARLSLLTPQTANVIVVNLEKSGAIRRTPHAVHGRIQQIEVTEHGAALLAVARERIQALEGELTDDMPPDEERIVRKWLVGVAEGG
ncbi:DNA-binding transcriptional regulator, MarR family [Faunimonas pinastri]|uniref:DNA-binding transcriptional regulator, MarR family n=1 Tax=Faunimonas pinastri TaxID=1855383 RepID=A0A1H9LCR0_9HYPH|nr:MarR family transcriptional regulator [Faunimonas pinastri]SER08945.1 DNA-binding transcriptional regulator, MarR family [Faunimonas pinastri]